MLVWELSAIRWKSVPSVRKADGTQSEGPTAARDSTCAAMPLPAPASGKCLQAGQEDVALTHRGWRATVPVKKGPREVLCNTIESYAGMFFLPLSAFVGFLFVNIQVATPGYMPGRTNGRRDNQDPEPSEDQSPRGTGLFRSVLVFYCLSLEGRLKDFGCLCMKGD